MRSRLFLIVSDAARWNDSSSAHSSCLASTSLGRFTLPLWMSPGVVAPPKSFGCSRGTVNAKGPMSGTHFRFGGSWTVKPLDSRTSMAAVGLIRGTCWPTPRSWSTHRRRRAKTARVSATKAVPSRRFPSRCSRWTEPLIRSVVLNGSARNRESRGGRMCRRPRVSSLWARWRQGRNTARGCSASGGAASPSRGNNMQPSSCRLASTLDPLEISAPRHWSSRLPSTHPRSVNDRKNEHRTAGFPSGRTSPKCCFFKALPGVAMGGWGIASNGVEGTRSSASSLPLWRGVWGASRAVPWSSGEHFAVANGAKRSPSRTATSSGAMVRPENKRDCMGRAFV
mmetsp:Transcript_27097/g.78912  ORF Transcript_27097/g.78912 Transcript_27097/m.78912 type:complete len:339 (+) Transcript_27097:20-1036(+)